MLGSSLYFIALLATAELETEQTQTVQLDNTNIQTNLTQEQIASIDNTVISETTKAATTITNCIEPRMLAYKHWTGTYSPETFTLFINDTEVPAGKTYTLKKKDEPLIVKFDYSFMNGMRKGTKKISYLLNENTTCANLTFSWTDTWKVIIDNATPTAQETT